MISTTSCRRALGAARVGAYGSSSADTFYGVVALLALTVGLYRLNRGDFQ